MSCELILHTITFLCRVMQYRNIDTKLHTLFLQINPTVCSCRKPLHPEPIKNSPTELHKNYYTEKITPKHYPSGSTHWTGRENNPVFLWCILILFVVCFRHLIKRLDSAVSQWWRVTSNKRIESIPFAISFKFTGYVSLCDIFMLNRVPLSDILKG